MHTLWPMEGALAQGYVSEAALAKPTGSCAFKVCVRGTQAVVVGANASITKLLAPQQPKHHEELTHTRSDTCLHP